MSKFIVIEGPDGSGTTTQSRLLSENLNEKGIETLLTAEPTEGPIGYYIRKILQEHKPISATALQLLFCADRAEHLQETILPALESGKTVITDRYFHSTLCYGKALGLEIEWLEEVNRNFLKPDTTLFILPSLATCLKRVAKRNDKDSLEGQELQEKVYSAYEIMAEEQNIPIIDSSKDFDFSQQKVLSLVSELV